MGVYNLYSKTELICPMVKPTASSQTQKQTCGRALSTVCKQTTPCQGNSEQTQQLHCKKCSLVLEFTVNDNTMLKSLLHFRYLCQSDRTCGNLVAQASAATVDHHAHLPFVVDAHLPGSIFVVNVIHDLDLGVMISSSQGSQLPITTHGSDSARQPASGSTGESYGNMRNRENCYSKVLVLEKLFQGEKKKNPTI